MNGTGEKLKDGMRARAGETIAPAFQKAAFHCRYCAVFAPQEWTVLRREESAYPAPRFPATRIWISECANCHGECYWLEGVGESPDHKMLWPGGGSAPAAHASMPPDVREDYEEAREISEKSARGAAALLRLALQKLMPHLGQKGKDINDDIAALVRQGLDARVTPA